MTELNYGSVLFLGGPLHGATERVRAGELRHRALAPVPVDYYPPNVDDAATAEGPLVVEYERRFFFDRATGISGSIFVPIQWSTSEASESFREWIRYGA